MNGTAAGNLYAAEVRNGLEMEVEKEVKEESKIAVILLLVGIISFRSFSTKPSLYGDIFGGFEMQFLSTRLGLWVADLSVQQILQERVAAHCRGGC